MATNIDYYFAGSSPFTYLGHQAILDVAKRHDILLNFKPVNPAGVWKESGSVPLPQRTPTRKRYRFLELQRIAHMRNLPINLEPAHFPVDPTLADCCVIVLGMQGKNPADYMNRVFSAVWTQEANIADETAIAELLTESGFEPAAIIEAAKSNEVAEMRHLYTEEAAGNDAVGVPAFVLNGEVFWGQDRIEFIDHALTTGRAPFGQPPS
ncbi:MAG: 2-hydroxychromene-2-carboxylate isomerase [Rhizobiaceae bacterium]